MKQAERTQGPTREPLTRERILEAAVGVMDAEGLEAVTMRRIGRELGVEAMSLYNHVEGKPAILEGILDSVMGELELPSPHGGDWVERARRGAMAFRALLQRHPNVVTLFAEHRGPVKSLGVLRASDWLLDSLRRAGVPPEDSVHAFHTIVGYVMGFVMREVGGFLGSEEEHEHEHEDGHEELERMVADADLPRIAELFPYLAECRSDAEFEYGLDLILTGLRAKLAGR